jgi:anti-sigma factor RsiW
MRDETSEVMADSMADERGNRLCADSPRLVAWIDGELERDEMAEIASHLEVCARCQGKLDAYRQASAAFGAYCDALNAAEARHGVRRWVPALAGAAAAMVAVVGLALCLLLLRPRAVPPITFPAVKAVPPAMALQKAPVPSPAAPRPHAAARLQRTARDARSPGQARQTSQAPNWLPTEPAIQIAFPAESMFPPGAFPEGVNFTADLSISSDGSAQQIRLRPRLIGFN